MIEERIPAVYKPRDPPMNHVAEQARILFEVDLPLFALLACQRRDGEHSIERSGVLYEFTHIWKPTK